MPVEIESDIPRQKETVGVLFFFESLFEPLISTQYAYSRFKNDLASVIARLPSGAIPSAPICPAYSLIRNVPPIIFALNRNSTSCDVAIAACTLGTVVITAPR